ncbi:MAG: hypothetical protein SH856_09430 [Flavobacteriales bacterium]|nr:hypothetical protein [Flavobacteriales bacterium]
MMGKVLIKILIGLLALLVLLKIITMVWIEPWVGKKIENSFNDGSKIYSVEIGGVDISILDRGITLKNIEVFSRAKESDNHLTIGLSSIRLSGINLGSLFRKDLDIREISVSRCNARGNISSAKELKPPTILPSNIRIGTMRIEEINLEVGDSGGVRTLVLKQGKLKAYDLQINKGDTLTNGILKEFDFEVEEMVSKTAVGMYSFKGTDINYSTSSKALTLKKISVLPNYTGYDFTSRFEFETDCIEVECSHITFLDFSASAYASSNILTCSYIEIGEMDMNVFRDKRKAFRHRSRPTFQQIIYNYPGMISIDSIGIESGKVYYKEHAEEANAAGHISFEEIKARIYNISNDTLYKTEKSFLELRSEALVMGRGKLNIYLKTRLFDARNTFTVQGTMTGMDASALNPIMENNGFVYATAGRMEKMNFSFVADNNKADGNMTMLYSGLDVAVKNKRTDDTTSLKERVISIIANRIILNSNPVPGEAVREGIIECESDPEKFLFNYCYKAILSGIKSSVSREAGKAAKGNKKQNRLDRKSRREDGI